MTTHEKNEWTEDEQKSLAEFQKEAVAADEVGLYFIINAIGAFTWRMNHDLAHARIESTPTIERNLVWMGERGALAVDQTVRFGVASPARDPETGQANPEYWKWYRFWDAWKKGMTDREWSHFSKVYDVGKETNRADLYDGLLPEQKWNEEAPEEKEEGEAP